MLLLSLLFIFGTNINRDALTKFFVPPICSESMNIEYLPIMSPDLILAFMKIINRILIVLIDKQAHLSCHVTILHIFILYK